MDNARKLSSLSLKRENAAEIEQLHRVEATGDADKENELLRAAIARARKRHGLSVTAGGMRFDPAQTRPGFLRSGSGELPVNFGRSEG